MNEQQKETLQALRTAAQKDQWKLRHESLVKLLSDLKQSDSLRMVARQAQRFLSDFSRSHPEDDAIVKAIEALGHMTSLEEIDRQGKIIDPLLDKYWDWPGVSNFRNAFKGISKPQQYFEHSGEYIDTIVSMLSGLSIAIEANNYWGGNPEFSKTFFGPDVRKAVLMVAKHHSDPEQVAFRISLWSEIANDLEMALQAVK
ncbi:MAG: hypothetical protein GC204_13900 [Chloroflexi bacterium]|nr:hypothetical protein [Chloroflexota bacterium]